MGSEVFDEFLEELTTLVGQLERDLVSVDGGRDPAEVVPQTFRVFHTVKGTGGFLGLTNLTSLCHAAEELLVSIREGKVPWSREITDLLLHVLDAMRAMMDEFKATEKDGTNAYESLVSGLRAVALPHGAAPAAAPPGVHFPPPPPAPPPELAPRAAPPPPTAAAIPAAAGADPAAPAAPPAPMFEPRKASPKLVRKKPAGPAASAAPPAAAPAAMPSAPAAASPAAAGHPPAPARATPSSQPGQGAGHEAGEASGTLRVPLPVLDRLMNLVGELVLARNQLLAIEQVQADGRLGATSQRIDSLTAGLQEAVMRARLQPIDNVFARLPRVARDAARACGKEVRLFTAGSDTEIDKTLLEAIGDPLIHLVRNAVDHGIEPPELRTNIGKPEVGMVAVRAFQDGGLVVVEVEDDGGGINVEKVKAKARSLGLITPEEASRLSERETFELLFRPGFSTADKITQISGRGVGMDVVRNSVEQIGGSVDLVSVAGKGSTFRIRVPLTLVIVPALVVRAGEGRYAVPQASLKELVRISPDREARMVADIQGAPVLRLRGHLVPVVDLRRTLGLPPAPASQDSGRTMVVLNSNGRPFALEVDDVLDTEEIVVKPLGAQVQSLGVYAGATVRGDGRVALVLDVQGLGRRAGLSAEELRVDPTAASQGASRASSFLILQGADDGRLAVPLAAVTRLEEIDASRLERTGGGEAIQYRGAILPVVRLSSLLTERRRTPRTAPPPASGRVQLVVQEIGGRRVGLLVEGVLDVVEEIIEIDQGNLRPGVVGRAVIQDRITELLDTSALLEARLAPPTLEAAHG